MIGAKIQNSILAFSGQDAAKFLQGQCTCDVLKLDQSSLGAFCNAKGRVISLFRIFKHEGVFYVILPQELAERMQKHLLKYVLRSDVKIELLDDSWAVYGLMGEGLPEPGFVFPEKRDEVCFGENGFVINLSYQDSKRFWLVSNVRQAFETAHSEVWDLEDIKSGIPMIVEATSESFVPQMLNLDLLGGISFEKGCYTGQEIVARAHYLGSLKRRLYRLQSLDAQTPQAGDSIYAGDLAVGTVINAAAVQDGFQMLAVLNIEQADADLRLFQTGGPKVTLNP